MFNYKQAFNYKIVTVLMKQILNIKVITIYLGDSGHFILFWNCEVFSFLF